MRACGRVTSSELLQFDERHPIILPYDCHLSQLLVEFTHRITLHGGNQLMIRLIRAKLWIPRVRNLVKSVVYAYKVCVIHKKKLQTQLMGELPKERTSFSRPFTYTGGDYAGPFEIKNYTGRACLITKGYVLVFVCFSTPGEDAPIKCITSSFSGISFLREPPHGRPVGGRRQELQDLVLQVFYTFEELATLLARIEACLNSRPLAPMSEDPADLMALSPGHFLVGGPLLVTVEPELKGDTTSIINRWQHLKALQQQFRLRWKEEYLKELHKGYGRSVQ
ncbi:uncharacterized protein LOC121530272 [Drosophila eugracilis]|uniref:uncharacterized protein LOC121530272 n=1 Tax=Drosophila eugracilis TaxID=29029 RepID=UPI001BD9D293|nr:uncharacterized protein LOC121530272 [Drosophila eugracilis]